MSKWTNGNNADDANEKCRVRALKDTPFVIENGVKVYKCQTNTCEGYGFDNVGLEDTYGSENVIDELPLLPEPNNEDELVFEIAKPRTKRSTSEFTKQSSLTDNQILDILTNTSMNAAMAIKYGVRPSVISLIRAGKLYGHLYARASRPHTIPPR